MNKFLANMRQTASCFVQSRKRKLNGILATPQDFYAERTFFSSVNVYHTYYTRLLRLKVPAIPSFTATGRQFGHFSSSFFGEPLSLILEK